MVSWNSNKIEIASPVLKKLIPLALAWNSNKKKQLRTLFKKEEQEQLGSLLKRNHYKKGKLVDCNSKTKGIASRKKRKIIE